MLAINIHGVSSVKTTKIREQKTSEASYVKHLIIHSKDGVLNISLFADNAEALKVKKAGL